MSAIGSQNPGSFEVKLGDIVIPLNKLSENIQFLSPNLLDDIIITLRAQAKDQRLPGQDRLAINGVIADLEKKRAEIGAQPQNLHAMLEGLDEAVTDQAEVDGMLSVVTFLEDAKGISPDRARELREALEQKRREIIAEEIEAEKKVKKAQASRYWKAVGGALVLGTVADKHFLTQRDHVNASIFAAKTTKDVINGVVDLGTSTASYVNNNDTLFNLVGDTGASTAASGVLVGTALLAVMLLMAFRKIVIALLTAVVIGYLVSLAMTAASGALALAGASAFLLNAAPAVAALCKAAVAPVAAYSAAVGFGAGAATIVHFIYEGKMAKWLKNELLARHAANVLETIRMPEAADSLRKLRGHKPALVRRTPS